MVPCEAFWQMDTTNYNLSKLEANWLRYDFANMKRDFYLDVYTILNQLFELAYKLKYALLFWRVYVTIIVHAFYNILPPIF